MILSLHTVSWPFSGIPIESALRPSDILTVRKWQANGKTTDSDLRWCLKHHRSFFTTVCTKNRKVAKRKKNHVQISPHYIQRHQLLSFCFRWGSTKRSLTFRRRKRRKKPQKYDFWFQKILKILPGFIDLVTTLREKRNRFTRSRWRFTARLVL